MSKGAERSVVEVELGVADVCEDSVMALARSSQCSRRTEKRSERMRLSLVIEGERRGGCRGGG